MRSHAKAATAGTTQRQANGLGRIFRGALATRDGFSSAKGSGAPAARTRSFSLAFLVSLLLIALGAASALAAAPTIPVTTVSGVTSKTAVLEADVSPEGEATTYHFEYGSADCSSNPCTSVPVPDANVGSGSSALRVTRELSGLQPGTTYHFRLVATNGSGSTNGPGRTFTTYGLPADSSNCPNQAFRVGAGARLPDCRAYEMVSPVDKNGGDIITLCQIECFRTALNQSAVSGDKFTFSSYKVFADAPSGHYSNQYMATRGPDGWVTEGIGAPQGTTVFDPFLSTRDETEVFFKAFSSDLSSAWLLDYNLVPLTPDAQAGLANLYRLDNGDGSFEALTNTTPAAPVAEKDVLVELQGVSADGSHAVFSSEAALTPNAPVSGQAKLYDFHNGQIDLVSVLPDDTATPDVAIAGGPTPSAGDKQRSSLRTHAVSEDGSRIFWTSVFNTDGGKLYVRIDGETTVTVSEDLLSQYWAASTDGSKVVYSSQKSLGGGIFSEPELYVFDVDTETPTLIAGDFSGVLGASDDLSYIYYASREALDAGATAGEWNLYLYREGTSTFISTLSTFDAGGAGDVNFSAPNPFDRSPIKHNSRVTPDGRHVAFMSTRSLTDYDNTDAISGEPDLEIFRYDADADELTCVSCNPSGARPAGHPLREPYSARSLNDAFGEEFDGKKIWTAAWLNTQENALYAPRALSEDGNRIFFNAFDALVPQDNNGRQDVYQWEAEGTGGCEKAGGCVDLISSGESDADSEFVDATPNGDNVFISTESSLVHQDLALIDIYNARVNGGYPPPPAPPTPCVGDACQNIPAAPNDPTPASANFRGAGDPVAKKPRRSCRSASRKAKGSKQAQRKRAKRCRRANRRAGR